MKVVTWQERIKSALGSRYFWFLVVMLSAITFLHYLTPQVRPLVPGERIRLSRHTVERIVFVLPVAAATFAFGQTGGAITLAVAVLLMLPRALWLSAYRIDALIETAATALVGYLVLWIVSTQEREKDLRQRAVSRMRAFNAMCSIVAKSLELEQILEDALDTAIELTDLDAGLVFFLDPQTDALVLAAHRNIPEGVVCEVERWASGKGVCGQVIRTGELMVIEDVFDDGRMAYSVLQVAEMRSQVIVPITSKEMVQGVMVLGTSEPYQFLPADLQMITTFGKQIGVGVENAHLHRDVERQLHIQRRLNEVAEKITSELELDRLLPKVLQIAEELIDADCGSIALFDPATKCLTFPYLHNLPNTLMELCVSGDMGASGRVVATGGSVVIEDYQNYKNAIPAFREAGVVSMVAVPLVSGKRTFGALTVGSLGRVKRFSQSDTSILAGVGRQAGIAIDNARLYENMRYYARQITRAQEDERKRIAREAHDETAQILVALSRRLDGLITSSEVPSEDFKRDLERVREMTTDALQSVRRFSQDLRPPVLDDLGFVAAVRGLTRTLEEQGVEASLDVQGDERRLAPEEELVLFRIAQESLNNVRRHAEASHVEVEIAFRQDNVEMTVEDDGIGFQAPDKYVDLIASGRLGLIGMHERARILGGTLQIESEPSEGTTVRVSAPVHSRS